MGYLVGQSASGFVTGPTAGVNICTLSFVAIPSVAVYKLLIRAGYNAGVPAGPEQNTGGNMGFYMDGVLTSTLGIPPVTGATSLFPVELTLFLRGGEALAVKAIVGGTTGVIYNAHLIVTPSPAQ